MEVQILFEMLDLNFGIVYDNGCYKTASGAYFCDQQRAVKAYNTQKIVEDIKEDALLEKLVESYINNKHKISKLQSENDSLKDYVKSYVERKYLNEEV